MQTESFSEAQIEVLQGTFNRNFYTCLFVLACVLFVVVKRSSSSSNEKEMSAEFKSFRKNFLIAHSIAMFADWLQGAHVYALYVSYNFSMMEISQLFLAGFGSSAIFGVFIGSVADKFGRRANCMMYCVAYILSCMTKHFPDYNILMFGRVLGGMATSVLASAFETWMRHEHDRRGFPGDWVDSTFSYMTFYGFGTTAIAAGLASQAAASALGYVGPFDLSALTLVGLLAYLPIYWCENYGNESQRVWANITQAASMMVTDRKMMLLGVVQSCFEGAMYTFVFMWTPVMEHEVEGVELPHGVIFSTFMVCCMLGSFIFSELVSRHAGRCEGFMRHVFIIAAVALFLPTLTNSKPVIYGGFIVFEVCCGIYFPSMGTMRYCHVPKDIQATVMNLYRIGINVLVMFMLTNAATIQNSVFSWCSLLLTVAALLQHQLMVIVSSNMSASRKAAAGLADDEAEEGMELVDNREMDA